MEDNSNSNKPTPVPVNRNLNTVRQNSKQLLKSQSQIRPYERLKTAEEVKDERNSISKPNTAQILVPTSKFS